MPACVGTNLKLVSLLRVVSLQCSTQQTYQKQGQIPPYAQPQITNFSIQEAVIKTVQAAVDAFGIKALEGSDGEVEVKEDVEQMAKGWKQGDSLTFTATINAAYDPEVERPSETAAAAASPDDVVVDAEIVEESTLRAIIVHVSAMLCVRACVWCECI